MKSAKMYGEKAIRLIGIMKFVFKNFCYVGNNE